MSYLIRKAFTFHKIVHTQGKVSAQLSATHFVSIKYLKDTLIEN